MNHSQQKCVADLIRTSEEREFFMEKMEELVATIAAMPITYATDGQGDDAICHLHYFGGSYDGYLIELDMEKGETPQEDNWQCHGFVHWQHYPGQGSTGYICIPEITKNNMDLDFHFKPTRLGDIKKKFGMESNPPACHAPTEEGEVINPTPPASTGIFGGWETLVKEIPQDTLLFIQLGDFYETFADQAKIAAPLMNVALTKRNMVPMCGIPVHAADAYILKLTAAGKRVALAVRTPDHPAGKSHEITRWICPATQEETNPIIDKQREFLAMPDPYQPGAIIYSSWGWEQTNIDFYRIEKRSGKFVTLIPITSDRTSNDGHMTGKCLPTDTPKNPETDHDVAWKNREDTIKCPTFRRMLKFTNKDGTPSGLFISHGWASIWKAKPMHWTGYA